MQVAPTRVVQNIPIQAITQLVDAARKIFILERSLIRGQVEHSVRQQGMRLSFSVLAVFFGILALQLAAFWAGVALFQAGFSIGKVVLFSVLGCTFLGLLSWGVGARTARYSLKRTVRELHPRQEHYGRRGSAERDRFTKEAA